MAHGLIITYSNFWSLTTLGWEWWHKKYVPVFRIFSFFCAQNKKLCNQAECDCNYIRLCCNFIHFEWNANSLWWNYRNFSPAILPKKWFAVAVIICRLLNVPNEFEFICTFNSFNADKFNGQFKCANTQRKIERERE